MKRNRPGFTLIELLVVIAIIGLLSSIVLAYVTSARTKGKVAVAKADLHDLHNASMQFSLDINRWPNSCPPGYPNQPTRFLDGLNTPIVITVFWESCGFTAQDVSSWNGPYISSAKLRDPWNTRYMMIDNDILGDPAYPSNTVLFVSAGPDRNYASFTDNIVKVIE